MEGLCVRSTLQLPFCCRTLLPVLTLSLLGFPGAAADTVAELATLDACVLRHDGAQPVDEKEDTVLDAVAVGRGLVPREPAETQAACTAVDGCVVTKRRAPRGVVCCVLCFPAVELQQGVVPGRVAGRSLRGVVIVSAGAALALLPPPALLPRTAALFPVLLPLESATQGPVLPLETATTGPAPDGMQTETLGAAPAAEVGVVGAGAALVAGIPITEVPIGQMGPLMEAPVLTAVVGTAAI